MSLGALLPVLGPIVGAIGGGLLGMEGQRSANEANAREGHANREWMEWMSNTAHVREVEDLRKAGLNPILSAGGKGASTPQAQNVQHQNTMGELAKGVANIPSMIAEQKQTEANVHLSTAQATNQAAQANSAMENAKGQALENIKNNEALPNWRKEQELRKEELKWDQKLQPMDMFLKRLGAATGAIGSAVTTGMAAKALSGVSKQLPKGLHKTPDGKSIFRKDTGERLDLP